MPVSTRVSSQVRWRVTRDRPGGGKTETWRTDEGRSGGPTMRADRSGSPRTAVQPGSVTEPRTGL